MKPELIHWLTDLGGYIELGLHRVVRPASKTGVDYGDPDYKDLARKVISRIHPHTMRLRVAEVIEETPSTKTLRFKRLDGPVPPFRAGQYVNLFVEIDGVRTSRPYSISSAPGADHIDLTVREKPGGFVSPYLLASVGVGDEFETTGPLGSFYHEPLIDGTELTFLAGGSGVTPFMSMIRSAASKEAAVDITLFYGCRTPDDVIFGRELKALAKKNPRIKFALVISEPPKGYRGMKGFLDAARIKRKVGDPEGKTFYLCGPTAMYDFCLPQLESLGVPSRRIKRELYGPPDDPIRLPGWPKGLKPDSIFSVEVEGRGTLSAVSGEPLLNSLERSGIVVPTQCRSGECSLCRTKLVSGKVLMPEYAGVRESDRATGHIHPCVSYPLEDLVIRVWS